MKMQIDTNKPFFICDSLYIWVAPQDTMGGEGRRICPDPFSVVVILIVSKNYGLELSQWAFFVLVPFEEYSGGGSYSRNKLPSQIE